MFRLKFFPVLLMPIILAGCLSTLHPLYTENTKVFDPGLIGRWVEEGENDTLIFTETGHKQFQFIYSNKGKRAEFEVYLAKLGETEFIDAVPESSEGENDLWSMLMVPTHIFGVYKRIGDQLTINMLTDDWLKKQLRSKAVDLPYEETDDNIILTASSDQLQKFAQTYASDTAVFEPGEPFLKIQ
jgi:hypothetical protein